MITRRPSGGNVYIPGPPEAVRDCWVENQSSDSVTISCTPGYDGGLKQSFVLEVYERRKEQLMKNLTRDDDPRFRMESLSPKTPYAFVIYSYNIKGRSSRTSVNYQITPVPSQDFVSNDPSASAAAAAAPPAHPSSSSPSSASAAGSPAPSSSSSAEGDSPSDSLNGANESRSDDGALPSSSSSSPASSSLSSLLMRVALLPVLGIVSGLILTFILLGVIFSVLHSIRKQERSGKRSGSQSTAGCSLGPGMPANRSLRSDSPTASCDSSAAFNRHVQESVSFNFLLHVSRFVASSFCHVLSSSSSHLLPGGHSLLPSACTHLPPFLFHLVRYCVTSFCYVCVYMCVCVLLTLLCRPVTVTWCSMLSEISSFPRDGREKAVNVIHGSGRSDIMMKTLSSPS